jgi:hypothetical protein
MMSVNRRILIALVAGFVLGTLWLVAFRFLTFKDTRIHYHANFALYINGQKDPLASSTFYEETQSCSADEVGPKQRVHLHDQKPEVVHVHDEGSTWAHLFANLGYGLNNKSVQTDAGVFVDGQDGNDLTFMLNGKKVDGVANEVIQSEDVLLINYGKDDAPTLQTRYDQIEKNANEYNKTSDPSTCSGSKPITFTERLKKAIGLSE